MKAFKVNSSVTEEHFLSLVLQNNFNRILLERLPKLGLAQTHLVAGCLFQTVWNVLSNRPATEQIKDYDVFYFDDSDLSYEAEDAAIKKANELFADLPVEVELRNQARVHLWYEQHFAYPSPTLTSARHGVDRYLVRGTCLGVSATSKDIYAPYGFTDLEDGLLRPNPNNDLPDLFLAKAKSYQARWPWLLIQGA